MKKIYAIIIISSLFYNMRLNNISSFKIGESGIGVINIPKISLNSSILPVTTYEDLNNSITRFYNKIAVNEIGNLILAGHNYQDGTLFSDLKYLELRDIIDLTDLNNKKISYQIYSKYYLKPEDGQQIVDIDTNSREVTLITCSDDNLMRLVIHAKEI